MASRSRTRNVGAKSHNDEPEIKKRVENSWLILAEESLLENNKQISAVTLPHPGSGAPTKYLLDKAGSKVLEMMAYDEPNRSWLIGETIKSDGKIYITTPIHPTFLVLPRLKEECSNKAVPLQDLLSEKGFDNILDYVSDLSHVADLKGPADMKAYKYNEGKAVAWLEARVRRVAVTLRKKNVHVTAGAVSATFVTSSKDDSDVDEEFYLKYAYGIVSQYLPEAMAETLEKHFNFKPELIESLSNKRKSETEQNDTKRKLIKTELTEEHKENSKVNPNQNVKLVKPATMTNKEKAMQKAASGTKTISSFFTKK